MNATDLHSQPDAQLQARIARLLHPTPRRYRRVAGGGYTPAARWIAETEQGRYFIKVATTPLTAQFVLREIRNYHLLQAPFMPRLIAADAEEDAPFLILEDLSDCHWPPPWTPAHIQAVVETVGHMHAMTPEIETYAALNGTKIMGWNEVARDPHPFLSLGVASAAWLEGALPSLLDWESRCSTEGSALTHMDLRSDNLCLRGSGNGSGEVVGAGAEAILVDWNLACLSNPKLDLGFWLPSLAFEGGPAPEALLPDAPEVAAWVSGFFASRAGLPDIPDAPRVRLVQRQQLETALPWVVRALDLPPPLMPQPSP
jgi:hypothetical protein